MNTQDEQQDQVRESAQNPFPEPQTIPSGWDTSVFASPSQLASMEKSDLPVESKPMNSAG